jgi:hypothetical protein
MVVDGRPRQPRADGVSSALANIDAPGHIATTGEAAGDKSGLQPLHSAIVASLLEQGKDRSCGRHAGEPALGLLS